MQGQQKEMITVVEITPDFARAAQGVLPHLSAYRSAVGEDKISEKQAFAELCERRLGLQLDSTSLMIVEAMRAAERYYQVPILQRALGKHEDAAFAVAMEDSGRKDQLLSVYSDYNGNSQYTRLAKRLPWVCGALPLFIVLEAAFNPSQDVSDLSAAPMALFIALGGVSAFIGVALDKHYHNKWQKARAAFPEVSLD